MVERRETRGASLSSPRWFVSLGMGLEAQTGDSLICSCAQLFRSAVVVHARLLLYAFFVLVPLDVSYHTYT